MTRSRYDNLQPRRRPRRYVWLRFVVIVAVLLVVLWMWWLGNLITSTAPDVPVPSLPPPTPLSGQTS